MAGYGGSVVPLQKINWLIKVLFLAFTIFCSTLHAKAALIEGVFWQPDNTTINPSGVWDAIGAHTFVIQYAVTDGKSWYKSRHFERWSVQNDWRRIRSEPWSRHFILGLAGSYDEPKARSSLPLLLYQSQLLIEESRGLRPSAYYFPVEVDPSWTDLSEYVQVLNQLPRPLWISVYSGDKSSRDIAPWLLSWLPKDVNVFFQDGVGVGTRSPQQALKMYKNIKRALGSQRAALISEAFRPNHFFTGFRSATIFELEEQISVYRGERIYIFDGPHYLGRLGTYYLRQKLM